MFFSTLTSFKVFSFMSSAGAKGMFVVLWIAMILRCIGNLQQTFVTFVTSENNAVNTLSKSQILFLVTLASPSQYF